MAFVLDATAERERERERERDGVQSRCWATRRSSGFTLEARPVVSGKFGVWRSCAIQYSQQVLECLQEKEGAKEGAGTRHSVQIYMGDNMHQFKDKLADACKARRLKSAKIFP